jgi:hypothetical protein
MQVIPKSLLLTSCSWDNGAYESFRMLPVTQECPYVEAFYDPLEKLLVVLSKDKKESLAMIPKTDEYGNGMKKNNRPLMDRQRMVSFKEFYITKPEEIKQFINLFAYNANVFNYHKILETFKPTLVDPIGKKVEAV